MPPKTIHPAVAEEVELCICSSCGREYPPEEGTVFDEQELCPDCLEELTSLCGYCGERIWNESNAGDSTTSFSASAATITTTPSVKAAVPLSISAMPTAPTMTTATSLAYCD